MIKNCELKYQDNNPDELLTNEESFEDLLKKNTDFIKFEPGQKIKSRVISINKDCAFIDVAGKSEGIIPINEFLDENGNLCIREGDEISAFFVSVRDGLRYFTTMIHGYPFFKLTTIEHSYKLGIPIEGLVKDKVKGGFDISLNGIRAFCPASQIDLKKSGESEYIGRKFYFKIVEYNEEPLNIVVSRRALLEEEREARIDILKKSLNVGMDVKVRVKSIHNFGVFADLGGIDGFIPVSEISWDRFERPQDVLSINQEITTRIISLEWEENRITLSIKALQPDPWADAEERYAVGTKISGTVIKLAPFGAFVNIGHGIDGLLHISNMGSGRKIKHPREVLDVGQRVEAYIQAIDLNERKISLSMQPKIDYKDLSFPEKGEVIQATVEKIMPFGIFVKLNDFLNALIPNSEIGSDSTKNYHVGSSINVVIIEVDKTKGRVLASIKDAIKLIEQRELQQYKDSLKQRETNKDISSFGELLKAKLAEKNNPL